MRLLASRVVNSDNSNIQHASRSGLAVACWLAGQTTFRAMSIVFRTLRHVILRNQPDG